MTLVLLLGTMLLVSVILGVLAKLDARELIVQTLGMGLAAMAFYGLVALVA